MTAKSSCVIWHCHFILFFCWDIMLLLWRPFDVGKFRPLPGYLLKFSCNVVETIRYFKDSILQTTLKDSIFYTCSFTIMKVKRQLALELMIVDQMIMCLGELLYLRPGYLGITCTLSMQIVAIT